MSANTQTPNTSAKILIAEDSPTQAQRLQYILQQQGYEVAVAGNGRLALELARQFEPTLVISDVVMPEMDGCELSRRIKADADLSDIPVILVTTMSDPQDVIRGLECGADGFVLKPYKADYLLRQVRYVLSNRAAPTKKDAAAGVEILFNVEKHVITADRPQILNLLLSTYGAAIERTKELQRSHQQLQELNAKLNDTNQSLKSFSYSASHDLRAPLRHISGYAALLLKEAEGQLSPNAMRYLEEMTGASRRMSQLIEDLLEFSRMGGAEMNETTVDLNALVQACIGDLEMATRGRSVAWNLSPLPAAIGDPAMLKQVFANLLGNAVKYTRPREDAVIEIGCAAVNEREIVLFVLDNGVGFDMKRADKLFEAFQRLHGTDEFEGTGIGLATVRRIVTRHGGRVWAEAVPNQGATFYLTLRPTPARQCPAGAGQTDQV